jgi:hypothetical protein
MLRYCVTCVSVKVLCGVCYVTFEMLGDLNAGEESEPSALWWQHIGG